jgi:hypothetical protein
MEGLPAPQPKWVLACPSRECPEATSLMLLEAGGSEVGLPKEKKEPLMVEKKMVKCIVGTECALLMVGCCAQKHL